MGCTPFPPFASSSSPTLANDNKWFAPEFSTALEPLNDGRPLRGHALAPHPSACHRECNHAISIAEIDLGALCGQRLNRRIPDHLSRPRGDWRMAAGTQPACGSRVDWQFRTGNARTTLKHLYPKI